MFGRRSRVGIVFAALLVTGCGGDSEREVSICRNAWQKVVIPDEFSGFQASAAAWHEERLYLFGGDASDPLAGLVYEPPNRFLALSSAGQPAFGELEAIVRVENEIVVMIRQVYFEDRDEFVFGLRYDTVSDSWALLPPLAAGERNDLAAAPMGDEMLAVHYDGSPSSDSIEPPEYLAWAPATGWRTLSAPPAPGNWLRGTWTGQEVVLWGEDDPLEQFDAPPAMRYDPEQDSWREVTIANAPSLSHNDPGAWTGAELVVDSGRYYPDRDAWETMSDSDSKWGTPLAVGRRIVYWEMGEHRPPSDSLQAEGAVYDAEADSWAPPMTDRCLDRSGHSVVKAWVDDGLFAWIARDGETPDLAWYLPAKAVFGELPKDQPGCSCPAPLGED